MKVSLFKILIAIMLLSAVSLAQQKEQVIVKKAKFNTGCPAYNLYLCGDYAYVTTNTGIAVINIQDTSNPVQSDIIKTKGAAVDIKGRDQKIYFVTYDGSFSIADIANPGKPEIIGSVNNLEMTSDLAVAGSLAYINQDNGKMLIFNIENPADLRLVNTLELSKTGQDILLVDNVLYVAVRGRGLLIFDAANPSAPVLKKEIPLDGFAKCLDVDKNLLIAGSRSGPVNIFDISNPFSPVKVSSIENIGSAFDVYAKDGKLMVADEELKNVLLYDISDPGNPVRLNKIEFSFPPHSVLFELNHIYVPAVDGFYIFEIEDRN